MWEMGNPKQGRCHTLKEKLFSKKKKEINKKIKKKKKKKIEKKKNSKKLRELHVMISQKTNCQRRKKSRKTHDFNRND